jgi:hypothetical protein
VEERKFFEKVDDIERFVQLVEYFDEHSRVKLPLVSTEIVLPSVGRKHLDMYAMCILTYFYFFP